MVEHRFLIALEEGTNITCISDGSELICNGTVYVEKDEPLNYTDKLFWIYLGIYVVLVIIAGIVSGLTMGLLSMDMIGLNVLEHSGKPKEKKYASKIIPIVKRHHLLLVTLLLTNAAAVESMPLFLDRISNPITAVAVSVSAVLIFGEILPQAICTRYGLAIGATMAPVVKILMLLTLPLSWPLSKGLDLMLGEEHKTFFRRAELSALVALHQQEDGNEDPLSKTEAQIISGALSMREKVAGQVHKPLDKVFSIDINGVMDGTAVERILATGHSRIPVHEGDKSNIHGLLLVKRLLKLGRNWPIPVRRIFQEQGHEIPKVSENDHLFDLLHQFQKGKSHMCCVTSMSGGILGILTLEDIIEELIQGQILDETDFEELRKMSVVQTKFVRRLSQYRASISVPGLSRSGSLRPETAMNGINEESEATPLLKPQC